jgi:hypothetical protein
LTGRTLRERLAAVPRPYWWALGLYLVLAAVFIHDWDGYVFATSARQVWEGKTPYDVAQSEPWYAFLNPADKHVQWYAYPPLPLLMMALSSAPAVFLHLPPFLGRVLLKLPAILGTLALAAVAGGWAKRMEASEEDQNRIVRRFLFNPFLILVGPVWGMTDTLLMALYMGGLLAYSHGRPGRAGVLVALSVLVKPFPVLLLLAIAPYLLSRDGRKPFLRFCAAGAVTGLLVSAPFLVLDAAGYWQQSVGAHLARPPQGLTVWSLWPLDLLPDNAISLLSLALMATALLAVGVEATRLRGRGTSVVLTLAAACAILAFNRVVNEQYLVLVVAPMLVLDVAHRLDRFGHFLTRWTSWLFAAAIVLVGFHFLTFIPPDVANLFFYVPIDYAAAVVRGAAPGFWAFVRDFFEVAVPLTLAALGVLAFRIMRSSWRREHVPDPRQRAHLAPTVAVCILLLGLGFAPLLQQAVEAKPAPFQPASPEPRVAAFYYLWWQNPAHDPAVRYGNWGPVSEVPTMGGDEPAYYTTTRGVAREHVRMMLAAGIDTAFVSYHRGELERFRVFQEEAEAQGLRVAPLIELNQVYDQPEHHPVDHNGRRLPFASYRLDDGTQRAIGEFVLDLRDLLSRPSTLRLPSSHCPSGCPVVLFYDSYVSSISYHDEDKRSLARTLFGLLPTDELRSVFNDPTIAAPDDLLRHYPPIYSGFYDPGSASVWRQAHLAQHAAFWTDLRAQMEREVGPLHLVSGDAMNERAGFDAGTAKALVDLQVFDGSFIYSPSFTWGNQPKAPFDDTFDLWEDRNLWLTAFARGSDATSSFGIAPSYDDTVNRHAKGFTIPAFPPNATATFYDRGWASAIGQAPTLPAVATFNEHFEGSSIEPTVEYGDRFLDATLAQRRILDGTARVVRDVTVVVHERSSRTSLQFSETDLSHFWGLDLLAASARAIPGAQFSAIDALEPALPAVNAAPDLLLVEGGRGPFPVSAAVAQRLGGWSESPTLVLGPDESAALAATLGDNCLAGLSDVPDPKTLQPGDRLAAGNGTMHLERAGVAYVVGRTCEPGLRAGTSVKPWVATDPIHDPWGGSRDKLNAECMAVTLRALMPAFAAADAPASCSVS